MSWRRIVTGCLCAAALILISSKLAVAQEKVYLPILSAEQSVPDAVGVSAATNGNSKYKVKGEIASAYFYSVDECGDIYVNLVASDKWYAESQERTKISLLELSYGISNSCTGNFQYGFGQTELAANSFTIQNSLASAGLNATLTVCDYYSGICQPAEVNLTWDANGPRFQSQSHWSDGVPGCRNLLRHKGTSRDAGISGSVLIGGTDFTSGTDRYANLTNVTDGSITVGCDNP